MTNIFFFKFNKKNGYLYDLFLPKGIWKYEILYKAPLYSKMQKSTYLPTFNTYDCISVGT